MYSYLGDTSLALGLGQHKSAPDCHWMQRLKRPWLGARGVFSWEHVAVDPGTPKTQPASGAVSRGVAADVGGEFPAVCALVGCGSAGVGGAHPSVSGRENVRRLRRTCADGRNESHDYRASLPAAVTSPDRLLPGPSVHSRLSRQLF